MPQFYTLLTDTGQAKLANAVALGGTIEITELAIGDGNGSLPAPDSSATALINEVRRAPINTSQTDPDNPSWIVVEQVLPPDVGGWTIREIGIYDVDGDLIGIGNYPETYKPVLAEGSSRTQTVRFVLEVSDTSAVTLKVDPSVVLATREYVDGSLAAYGLGEADPGVPVLDDFANASTPTGFYRGYGHGTPNPTPNAPPGSGNSKLSAYALHVGGAVHWIVLENAGNATAAHRMFFGNTHEGGVIWNRVWHDGNVGAESGLNADLLDGQHGSYYRNAGNLNAGKVPVARLPAATENAIGAVEKATEDEAKSGAPGKHPDAAGVHAAFNQYGLGSGKNLGEADLDGITSPGLYHVSGNSINAPVVADGALMVSSTPHRPMQLYTALIENRSWVRTLTIGGDVNSWSQWAEVYTTNSDAALAKKDQPNVFSDLTFTLDTDNKRTLIGGASAHERPKGAYIALEGNDYGGAGAGGNIDLRPGDDGEAWVLGTKIWRDGNAPSDISATGYTKLPNGWIMQWGTSTINGQVSVSLPIAFPNFKRGVAILGINSPTSNIEYVQVVKGTSLSSFTAVPYDSAQSNTVVGQLSFDWIAFGF